MSPSPIQTGAVAVELAKVYALKGKLPLVLDEVVVPVHIVGELDGAGVRICSAHQADGAGGAGITSAIGLENPVGSGVLVRVSAIWLEAQGANDVFVRKETGSPLIVRDSFSSGFTRDLRDTAAAVAGPITRTVAAGAGTPTAQSGPILRINAGGDTIVYPVELVLPPVTRIWLHPGADNVALGASFLWTEETLEPSQA